MSTSDMIGSDQVIRYLGRELTDRRVDLDLSRPQAVERIRQMTGVEIADRTLLAYEHGIRDMTIRRLLQLCAAYEASPVLVLASALHRANTDWCRECGR